MHERALKRGLHVQALMRRGGQGGVRTQEGLGSSVLGSSCASHSPPLPATPFKLGCSVLGRVVDEWTEVTGASWRYRLSPVAAAPQESEAFVPDSRFYYKLMHKFVVVPATRFITLHWMLEFHLRARKMCNKRYVAVAGVAWPSTRWSCRHQPGRRTAAITRHAGHDAHQLRGRLLENSCT